MELIPGLPGLVLEYFTFFVVKVLKFFFRIFGENLKSVAQKMAEFMFLWLIIQFKLRAQELKYSSLNNKSN